MIKILGIGGAGISAVDQMAIEGIVGVEFAICGNDSKVFERSSIKKRILIGNELEIATYETLGSNNELKEFLSNKITMLIVVAGMGGGTGTLATPIICKLAKDQGILTVAIITTPFSFEGSRRNQHALEGIELLKGTVDSYILVSNDGLRNIYGSSTLDNAFKVSDSTIHDCTKGLVELITVPGYMHIDFKDISMILKDAGLAIVANYKADGSKRALRAIEGALHSPLLNDYEIEDARYILLNISSGAKECTMDEVSIITDYIQEEAGINADLIWGNTFDEKLGDALKINLIATGFTHSSNIGAIKALKAGLEETLVSGNSEVLSLYFLEDEYTSDEIAEVISFLSDIYRNEGGDGLVIKKNDVFEFDTVLEPALF